MQIVQIPGFQKLGVQDRFETAIFVSKKINCCLKMVLNPQLMSCKLNLLEKNCLFQNSQEKICLAIFKSNFVAYPVFLLNSMNKSTGYATYLYRTLSILYYSLATQKKNPAIISAHFKLLIQNQCWKKLSGVNITWHSLSLKVATGS